MACLLSNLNLFAIESLSPEDQAKFNEAKAQYDVWGQTHPGMGYKDFNKEQADVAPCIHCPAPYALLSHILPILKALPNAAQIQPIGDLELQYAVAQTISKTGSHCSEIFQTFDEHLDKRTFDGQLVQVAEGVFDKYNQIAGLTYRAPGVDAAIYYYRDGANHVVQVIVDNKGSARFRYYEYTDKITEHDKVKAELNSHIPVLPNAVDSVVFIRQPQKPEVKPIVPQKIATDLAVEPTKPSLIDGHYSGSVHADIVHSHGVFKVLPTDMDVFDGAADVSVGKVKVSGTANTTVVSGHKVDVSVVMGDDKAKTPLLHYNIATSVDGKVKNQTIVVPVTIDVGAKLGVSGQISETRGAGTKTDVMVMDFFEPAVSGVQGKKEYVTVTVTQQQGQAIAYEAKRTFQTTESTYTASAGQAAGGGFVGVGYTPNKNPNSESIQLRLVDEGGRVAGYATYSRSFN